MGKLFNFILVEIKGMNQGMVNHNFSIFYPGIKYKYNDYIKWNTFMHLTKIFKVIF